MAIRFAGIFIEFARPVQVVRFDFENKKSDWLAFSNA